MFRFKDCRFARMSSGHYCLIRDLGPVKGGKGLRHHEVLIAFSLQVALRRVRRAALERFKPASADGAFLMKSAIARLSSRSLIGEGAAENSPIPNPRSISS
jgi:hypothetical protein